MNRDGQFVIFAVIGLFAAPMDCRSITKDAPQNFLKLRVQPSRSGKVHGSDSDDSGA